MRNTVQDAEETEPLLAKNLYDTVRKANEQKIPDALKAAEQLVDAGSRRGGRQGVPARRPGDRAVAGGRRARGPERPRRRDRRPAAGAGRAGRPRRSGQSRDRPGDRTEPAGQSRREGEARPEAGRPRTGQSAGEGEARPEAGRPAEQGQSAGQGQQGRGSGQRKARAAASNGQRDNGQGG